MKKSIGVKPRVFPMPVLLIATYNDDDTVNVMNMAWGGQCGQDMVALNISANHKTAKNLRKRRAFTLSVANAPYVKEADFFGIASGNKMKDKFERSGMTAIKSEQVDAPVVTEFPLTFECEVAEFQDQPYGLRVLGKVLNVLVDKDVLDEEGEVVPSKLQAIVFDPFRNGYYALGEKTGTAWGSGQELMD